MVQAFNNDKGITIDCSARGSYCANPKYYGWNQSGTNGAPIVLCASFFKRTPAAQVTALLHELSHAFGNTDDNSGYISGPLPAGIPTYTDINGNPLADSTTDALITNADTYRGLLEQYYLP